MSTSPTLSWNPSSNADTYEVHFGTTNPPPLVTTTSSTSYVPGTLSNGTTYYWNVVAVASCDGSRTTNTGGVYSFTTATGQGGLIYPFDEGSGSVAGDASGAGNDGTISGASWVGGVSGTALRFGAGDQDHVLVPQSVWNGFGDTVYVEAYIRPTSLSTWMTVLRKRAGYNDFIVGTTPSGQLYSSIQTGGFNGAPATSATVVQALTASSWTKVAVWYDGERLRLYQNDVEVAVSDVLSEPLDWTTNYFRTEVGNNTYDGGGSSYKFVGDIDEVKVLTTHPNPPLCSAPGSFSLSSPADGATGVSTSPTLSWGSSSGAGSYEVYFGTTNPPALVTTTASTSYAPPTLNNATTYYWNVVAVASCDAAKKTVNSGGVRSFSTASACNVPGSFTLSSPSNGATGVSTSPTLSWNPSSDADTYEVYFGTTNPPPLVTTTTSTSYAPGTLSDGATYYWNVVAVASCDGSTTTNTGGVYSFTTVSSLVCPGGALLCDDFNDGDAAGWQTFASGWSVDGGVYKGTNTAANTPTETVWSNGSSWSDYTIQADMYFPNSPPGGGSSSGSLIGRYTSSTGLVRCQLVWAISQGQWLLHLSDGSTLDSNPVSISSGNWYPISLSVIGNTASCGAAGQSVSIPLSVSGSGTVGLQNIHTPVWFDNVVVTPEVSSCNAPGSFTLSSPSNGASGVSTSPTLIWNPSSNADTYEVHFGTTNPPPLVTTTSSTSYAPGTLNNATTYYWNVVAVASCDGSRTTNTGGVYSFATATGQGGLIYAFDEGSGSVAGDASGAGNDGTISGASWVGGISGTALRFGAGNQDHVLVPQSVWNGFGDTVYVEAYIRPTSLSTWMTVLRKRAGYNDFIVGVTQSGQLYSSIQTGGFNGAPATSATVAQALSASSWTKVAVWYDGERLRLYQNDIEVAVSDVLSEPLDWTTNYFRTEVGNNTYDGGGSSYKFVGDIDEVKVVTTHPNPPLCSAPGSFTLSSPSNGASGVSTSPTLSWNPSSDADTYEVHFGTTNPPPLVTTTSSTSYVPGTLSNGTTYFWNVVAVASCDGSTTTNTGGVYSFTTMAAASCPNGELLCEDFESGVIPSTLTAVEGSVSVASGDGRTYLKLGDSTGGRACVETSALYSRSDDLVIAMDGWANGGGTADYWLSFYETLGTACTPTNGYTFGVNPIPSDLDFDYISRSINGSGTHLATGPRSASAGQWFGVAYHLESNGTLSLIINGETRVVTSDSNFDSGKILLRGWGEIRMDNLRICSGPNSLQQCGVALCEAPASFTLTSPASGATAVRTSPTLSWAPSAGAGSYEVYFGTSPSPPLVTTTTLTSYTPAALNPSTTYYWQIRAVASCDPAKKTVNTGGVRSFTTVVECNAPGSFTLSSPSDGASGVSTSPTLSWNPSSGAGSYEVYFGTSNPPPLVTTTTSTSYAPAGLQNGATYFWRIVAIASCDPTKKTSTETRSFSTVAACPTESITLGSPAAGAELESPVTFSWSPVSRASKYRVWVSVDSGAATLIGETTSTELTVPVESGSVTWFVEAVVPACPTIVSQMIQFTVKEAVSCPTELAVQLSPADGATNVSSPVSFSWQGVPDAVRYRLWISVDEVPFQDVVTTSATTASVDLDGERVEWYVEAMFSGCPSTNSITRSFGLQIVDPCQNAVPLLTFPLSETTESALVTFRWSGVAGAVEYRVWLVSQGRTTPTLLGSTGGASLRRQVPAGTHEWYVEALFQSCPSTRSTSGVFTVPEPVSCEDNGVPQLLSPASGTSSDSTRLTFRWTAVERALGYRLWAEREGGTPTPIGETTTGTEIEVVVPTGQIEWWVEAFFTGCPSSESERRGLTVLQNANCNRRTPFLLNPKDGARNVTSPVRLTWTAVGKSEGYEVWQRRNGAAGERVATVAAGSTAQLVDVPSGDYQWWVVATFSDCDAVRSPGARYTVVPPPSTCETPEPPVASGVGEVTTGETYRIFWTPVPGASFYEVEQSTFANFSQNTTSRLVSDVSTEYVNEVPATTPFFYRVRAIADCDQRKGRYSEVVEVRVIDDGANMELGNLDEVSETIEICTDAGGAVVTCSSAVTKGGLSLRAPITYTVAVDKPWITVSPGTVEIEPGGRATVTLTSDAAELDIGTNEATVIVTRADGGKHGVSNGTGTVPVSTSLVTPVSPLPKTAPPPDSIMLLAAAHSTGLNSFWQSDLRLANVGSQSQKYELTFVTAGQDGTEKARQVTTQASAGQTIAFNDLLRTLYGQGSITGENVLGTIEIRPIGEDSAFGTGSGTSQTIATSRTYNLTSSGTYGQFIPGIEFGKFIGIGDGVLTLQHIESSPDARTNFGFVEGAGEPAAVNFELFDASGNSLGSVIYNLQPGEFRQIPVLSQNGIQLSDGRAEVSVISNTGRVMVYAAVNDNLSGDPFLVLPNENYDALSSKYVVPGVATIDTGQALWKSDARIYNSSSEPVLTTLRFYMQNDPSTSAAMQVDLEPGEIRIMDDILVNGFNLPSGSGGVLHIESGTPGVLGITTRTYNQTEADGTYGQFIPAFTESDAVGLGDPGLQLLQIEQSEEFRTNLGLTEITGEDATVEITATVPGSPVAPGVAINLAGNEFTQLNSILAQMGLERAKNVRLQIRVMGGAGKVVAYASVIDNKTQDPTYVPAQ